MRLFVQDHKDFEVCFFETQRLDDNRRDPHPEEEQGSDAFSNAR